MARNNSKGFHCYIDKDILSPWRRRVQELKASNNAVIEMMMKRHLMMDDEEFFSLCHQANIENAQRRIAIHGEYKASGKENIRIPKKNFIELAQEAEQESGD